MKNNQLFLPNYYQTPFYSPQKEYFSNPLNKAMNTNSISNKNININQYPSFPLMFEIPKQKSNINYIPRTPSPTYKRRNFINLSDNTKFKESSNSPVIYHQLKGVDSIKKYQQVNYHPIRYLSPQPLNLSKNNNSRFISLYQNSPILINIEQKQAKIVRTPETKNNISYNQYKKSRNYNNINIVNNNSSYIYTAYNPLNSIKNITTIKPSNKNLIKQIPKGNNNNYLKIDYKANFINFNDSSRNNNYQIIHNMNKSNNSIDNNNRNINITQNNNYNYLNNMNKSNNSIDSNNNRNINITQNNNYNYFNNMNKSNNSINNNNNKNNNIIIKRLNNFDQNNNYLNNINIKKNIYLNLNNKFQSNFNIIKKNHKLEITDNYKNFIRNKNNIDIFHNYYNQNKNNINSKIFNDIKKNNINQNESLFNISNESYSNIKNNSNQNIPPNIPQNHINIIPIPKNKYIFHYGENDMINRTFNKDISVTKLVPEDNFDIREFKINKKIGEGTYGKIYSVTWTKNNELYALKKIIAYSQEELNTFKKRVKIMQDLMEKTHHNGFIKIYGGKCIPQKRIDEFHYYIIMELGGQDWEREILTRKSILLYYSEYELFQIILQLVKTLSLMQKNNVTHRDIKPQNILICKDVFKLCDFDDAKIIEGNGTILQPVRGSELYMSPILFYAYNSQVPNVLHNTYKSDVFSLGMTFFLAAALSAKPLCNMRELKDMNVISQIINDALTNRYSQNLINLIIKMLQIDENLRVDFIELEEYISKIWPN